MPGAVDNDDFAVINLTRGIYCATPSLIPEQYAFKLDNFILRNGVLEARYPFKVSNVGAETALNTFYSYNDIGFTPKIHPINFPADGTNAVTLIAGAVTRHGVANTDVLMGWNEKGEAKRCNFPGPGSPSGSLCVYNNILYAGTSSGVVKLNVGSWPTSLSSTAIASSPTFLTEIITHKSRLFGYTTTVGTQNRLYFTDAPAVGALPETWNTTVNFVDFNGPRGSTKINGIVSLNNYIYVFTNNGLFALYTYGGSASWSQKTINPDIQVHAPRQVVMKNNMMYFITNGGVYVTDGFDFKLISDGLSEIFNGYWQSDPRYYTLSLFNDGLALLATDPQRSAPVGDGYAIYKLFFTKLDEIAWTSLSVPPIYNGSTDVNRHTGFSSCDALFTGTNLRNVMSVCLITHLNTGAVSVLPYMYMQGMPVNSSFKDITQQIVGSTLNGTVDRAITLTFETRELFSSNFMRLKNFKAMYAHYSSDLDFVCTPTAFVDGKLVETPNLLRLSSDYGDMVGRGRTVKGTFETAHVGSLRFGLTFVFDIAGALSADYVGRYSMFTLSQLGIISVIHRDQPLSAGSPGFQ